MTDLNVVQVPFDIQSMQVEKEFSFGTSLSDLAALAEAAVVLQGPTLRPIRAAFAVEASAKVTPLTFTAESKTYRFAPDNFVYTTDEDGNEKVAGLGRWLTDKGTARLFVRLYM